MAWNRNEVGRREVPRKRGSLPTGKWWIVGGVVLALVAAGVCLLPDGEAEADVATAPVSRKLVRKISKTKKSPEESVRDAMPKSLPKKVRRKSSRVPSNIFSHLTGNDRRVAEAVQGALDANDFKATVRAAKEALKSDIAEVRQDAVEALGWFGAEALPELTACLADKDEGVRQVAGNYWEQAAQEIESPADQCAVVMAALGTLTDEDQLESLGGLLGGAALQFIDGEENEEQAAENRLAVIQGLSDIIEGEGADLRNIKAAKEVYSDITGHDWISLDEADRYLQKPDAYEEPDGN